MTRECGVIVLGEEVVNYEHNLKHITHPASISDSEQLAQPLRNFTPGIGSEPATRIRIVNQPKRFRMRVSKRGAKISEGLREGVETI
jgi:hypothetical protein